MRRLAIATLAALAAVTAGVTLLGSPALAQGDESPDSTMVTTVVDEVRSDASDDERPVDVARVDVLQVSGLFDPILLDEVESAIERADEEGSQALILQVNSRGTVVSDERRRGSDRTRRERAGPDRGLGRADRRPLLRVRPRRSSPWPT